MTKEARLIASKEESEARSVVSQLGLRRDLRGTYIIQECTGDENAYRTSIMRLMIKG